METKPLLSLDLPDIPLLKKGKVRNVYDLEKELLFVASDRISAFDVVMPNGIPQKGCVLNMLSAFWFDFLKNVAENHMVTADIDEIVSAHPALAKYREILSGRSMLVVKAEPILAECVVRGYISGSAWKDYRATGAVCGTKLPKGLRQSDKLPEPIFTPSTKAESGHDMNISETELKNNVGKDVFNFLKRKTIDAYEKARTFAESKGIIIADTKLEFGIVQEKIILMDEVFTPDSSRFWPKNDYSPGYPQKSFDKQFVRDYLENIGWDKMPPAPELPEDIVQKTSEKYLQAYEILTGKKL